MKAKENLIKIQKEISPIKNRGEIQKIPLGAVSEKELKRELKLLKVLAADPLIKEMTRTRSFAQWGGAIEYYDGTVVSVLLVDHFGTRTAYGISPELMDTPETLAELRDKPKQLTDWIYAADLVNGAGRNKIIGRQKLSVEQVQEDGGLKGDTTSFPAWAVGTGVEAVLWGQQRGICCTDCRNRRADAYNRKVLCAGDEVHFRGAGRAGGRLAAVAHGSIGRSAGRARPA